VKHDVGDTHVCMHHITWVNTLHGHSIKKWDLKSQCDGLWTPFRGTRCGLEKTGIILVFGDERECEIVLKL
jgi:hypothetical protein